jgi:hypothetical protein
LSGGVTLEQVEALLEQLPPRDQLALVARIGTRLSASIPAQAGAPAQAERSQQQRQELLDQLLKECEDIDDDSQGRDTAATIRSLRDERISGICRRDAGTPALP